MGDPEDSNDREQEVESGQHEHHRRTMDEGRRSYDNGFYRTGFWIVLTNGITAISILLGAWATNGVSKPDLANAMKARQEVRDAEMKTLNARIDIMASDHNSTMIKLDAVQADVIELKTLVKSIRNR